MAEYGPNALEESKRYGQNGGGKGNRLRDRILAYATNNIRVYIHNNTVVYGDNDVYQRNAAVACTVEILRWRTLIKCVCELARNC